MKGLPKTGADPGVLLGVLAAVESDAQVTQRKLSRDLGIALGLTNLYLKRCVRKGWVKIGQVPMRRYAYYLTPLCFRQKARLAREYLAWNLEFFRRARRQATELFAAARARDLSRVALVGIGDLAEVALLSAADAEVEIIGVLDASASSSRCAGAPVYRSLRHFLSAADGRNRTTQAIMVTEASDAAIAQALELATTLGLPVTPDYILLPRVLGLSWTAAFPGTGRRK